MKKTFLKILFLAILIGGFADVAVAQKKGTRKSTKRTTKAKTNTKIQPTVATADTAAVVVAPICHLLSNRSFGEQ